MLDAASIQHINKNESVSKGFTTDPYGQNLSLTSGLSFMATLHQNKRTVFSQIFFRATTCFLQCQNQIKEILGKPSLDSHEGLCSAYEFISY